MDPIDNLIPFTSSTAPAGEDQFLYTARRNHLEAIRLSLIPVEDALIADLAKLYRLKTVGQPVEIPKEVVIKDVVVRLS